MGKKDKGDHQFRRIYRVFFFFWSVSGKDVWKFFMQEVRKMCASVMPNEFSSLGLVFPIVGYG